MKKYNLTQSDYDQINSLIKLTALIDDLYIKLYELEINNKKDLEEYNKIINYLNLLLEKENEKYKEYNLTQSKSLAWLSYLLEKKLPTNSKIDIETILNQDYSNKTIKRILNRLLCNVESCEINNNVLFSEVKKEIEKEGLELPEEFITHSITSSVRIRKALESDVFGLYLSFLAETITDKNFESIKRELIKSKYNFSFINKNVEASMISNNFGLDTTFYIGSKMIAELQYISPSLYAFFKDSYGLKMLTDQIVEMLKIEDIDYNNPSKLTASVLRQNLIKAILLTLSDETIIGVKSVYKEIIETEIDTPSSFYNNISKGLINYCFENVKEEKNKLNVLTLINNN